MDPAQEASVVRIGVTVALHEGEQPVVGVVRIRAGAQLHCVAVAIRTIR